MPRARASSYRDKSRRLPWPRIGWFAITHLGATAQGNAAAVALPLYTALYRSMPLPPVRQVRFLHSIATRCLEPLRKKRTEVIDLVADFETLRQHAEQVKPPVLDEFCCPLPMELMVEPVPEATGAPHTIKRVFQPQ